MEPPGTCPRKKTAPPQDSLHHSRLLLANRFFRGRLFKLGRTYLGPSQRTHKLRRLAQQVPSLGGTTPHGHRPRGGSGQRQLDMHIFHFSPYFIRFSSFFFLLSDNYESFCSPSIGDVSQRIIHLTNLRWAVFVCR